MISVADYSLGVGKRMLVLERSRGDSGSRMVPRELAITKEERFPLFTFGDSFPAESHAGHPFSSESLACRGVVFLLPLRFRLLPNLF